jgi:hypothetical protein
MRELDYLPYEKAVEEMAREYAKVRPMDISAKPQEDMEPELDLNGHLYLHCLEQLMLLKQLRNSMRRRDIQIMIDELYQLKTQITDNTSNLIKGTKVNDSPAVSSLPLPALLKRLLQLEYHINVMSEKNIPLKIREDENRAAHLINELILYIYVFN